jgi:hypothetical protein
MSGITELMLVVDLLAKSSLKIFLALCGMILVFLTFPQSRTSSMFIAGTVGAFAGGVLIQLFQNQIDISLLWVACVSTGFGMILIPLLNILSRLNAKLYEDKELIDELYTFLKISVKNRFSFLTKKKK